jgi:alginate O-acetyltransferase complex protein AlgI
VLFPTVQFALFFPVVLMLSWALMPRQNLWKPFIVVASYVFYGYASWRFCILLGVVTLGNQAAAMALGRTEEEKRRRWIVGVAVALDLGVLAVFKY